MASVGEDHFSICQKYKASLAQDNNNSTGRSYQLTPLPVKLHQEHASVPVSENVNRGTMAGAKRSLAPETPAAAEVSGEGPTKVTPPAPVVGATVAATTCLTCGKSNCPYENGYTVMKDGGEKEFDPSEPKASTASAFSFEKVKEPINIVVGGMMKASGFWSKHKYIGDTQLDFKLMTWMNNHVDPALVESNWAALRHSAKETIHYKRQRAVIWMRKAYFGELFS